MALRPVFGRRLSSRQVAAPLPDTGGQIVGILLAAGRSERFGSNKLLQCGHADRPIAAVAARKLADVCDVAIGVVGPHSSEALHDCLRGEGLALVVAEDAMQGMGASLAAGVQATPDAAGWVVALADMPGIGSGTMRRVVAALRAGASIAAPVCESRRGHPVGFAAEWLTPLRELTGDTGARSILTAHGRRISLVEVSDPGILVDIDTPADLAAAGRFVD